MEKLTINPEIISISIQLTKEQGDQIKELIREHYHHAFAHYCKRVGLRTPNFYNATNGERPCSLDWLQKLLSGIGYQASLSDPEIQIQVMSPGEPAIDVGLLEQEIELLLEEKEGLEGLE